MAAWRFFPVTAGRKTPALEGDWREHATADEAQLERWEAEGYNLGLDLEPAGLAVIDLDGPDGERIWAGLCEGRPLPPTYEVRTPRGGRHIYFAGKLRPSVEKLGKKIDTRGIGSYVLVPGSSTSDGSYEITHDLPIAELPAWIPEALDAASPTRHDRAAAVQELDLAVNVARATRYLQQMAPVTEGRGADHTTYEVACELRDYGVSAERSIELMLEHYQVTPKDDRFEAFITRKVDNAWAYAQNDPGAWGTAPLAETFAAVLDQLPQEAREGVQDPYKALTEPEQDALKEPTWLMPGLIPDNSVVMLYGPPGSYKSFLALDIGLTLASGLPGWELSEGDPNAVVYVAGEGPRSIARLRRPAWRAVKQISAEVPFYLVRNMPLAYDQDQVHAFVASIKAQGVKPGLVIIDTWARFVWGLNENDAKDAGLAIAALEYIRRELRCSLLVVHHSGKDGERGPRGSGSILAGVDATLEVVPHKETRAVAVYNRRQKDADERTAPWLFEGQVAFGSLVFRPISPEVYRSLTQADDALDPRKVGAALLQLGAAGLEKAVTTHVLATKLRVQPAEESPLETATAVDRIVRQLRAAAKGRLQAYCERRGTELVWYMPTV